jgi:hypothetical protein
VKETVATQDCPAGREKVELGGTTQVSDSVKFGRVVKSVCPVSESAPELATHVNVRSLRVDPELFVRVIVCVLGAEPNICGRKVRAFGVSVIGCWQAVLPFNARQM